MTDTLIANARANLHLHLRQLLISAFHYDIEIEAITVCVEFKSLYNIQPGSAVMQLKAHAPRFAWGKRHLNLVAGTFRSFDFVVSRKENTVQVCVSSKHLEGNVPRFPLEALLRHKFQRQGIVFCSRNRGNRAIAVFVLFDYPAYDLCSPAIDLCFIKRCCDR